MRGYLLCASASGRSSPSVAPRAPLSADETVRTLPLSESACLAVWGQSPGDVQVCRGEGGSTLILNGYFTGSGGSGVDGLGEIAGGILRRLDAGLSLAELEELAVGLRGSFSLLHYQPGTGIVRVVSDRLASRPVWRVSLSDGWIFSSHAAAAAQVAGAAALDLGAAASFLLYGCPLDPTRSLFQGVESIREGAVFEFAPQGSAESRTWYRFRHSPEEGRSRREWGRLAAQRTIESARGLLAISPRPAVFLSGGVDSRIAAAGLRAAGAEPLLATLGDSVNLEIQVAKRVASALGCEHELILRDSRWYLRGLRRAVFETNGCHLWRHAHFSQGFQRSPALRQTDGALLGDFFEAFSKLFCADLQGRSQIWSEDEFVSEFDSIRPPAYRPLDRDRTLEFFRPEARQAALEGLEMRIRGRFREIREAAQDPRILVDYFMRWQNASCLPTFAMLLDVRSGSPERNLMFDWRLHELLQRLPSSMRDRAGLGAQLVKRLHPAAARVVNANSLLPITLPYAIHALSKAARPRVGKLKRRLLGGSHRTTASWPHLALIYASDTVWRQSIEDVLLDPGLFPREVFDGDVIARRWNEFRQGRLQDYQDLEKLLGIGVLLRIAAS